MLGAGDRMIGIQVPAGVAYREVRVVAKSPGVVLCGVRAREPQPEEVGFAFDHSVLPPV